MNNNENLDSMARRYKDEMMRLYRMNGGMNGTSSNTDTAHNSVGNSVTNTPNTVQNSQQPQVVQKQVTATGQCRFMTAEEIINGQTGGNTAGVPQPLPSYGDDVTDNLINGPIPTPYSLIGNGTVNSDNPMSGNAPAPRLANSAEGSESAAPNTSDSEGNMFRGFYINPIITGSNVNTQLGASDILSELLPSFEFPPDLSENESVPTTIDPRFIILSSWFDLTGDNGWGYLQFEVTTGSQGNPVQNATVTVSRVINGQRFLTRILRTNASGLTKTIFLPAPKYTYNPYRPSTSRPFAEYTASVYANGYYPLTNISLMVEAGVKSIQPVDLIPYPESGTLPGIQPRTDS